MLLSKHGTVSAARLVTWLVTWLVCVALFEASCWSYVTQTAITGFAIEIKWELDDMPPLVTWLVTVAPFEASLLVMLLEPPPPTLLWW
jgi:hypothetical protein